jgi:galactoside O-acetyltransferase
MGDYEDRNGAQVHRLANIVGAVEIGVGSRIDAFVTITGRVKIGRYVHIGAGVGIFGANGFEIGDYSGLSPGVQIFTATEDLSGRTVMHPTAPVERPVASSPIRVGEHCTIGANSVLLPGAELPDGACVGALSLVKTKLAPWSISAGIPAQYIKSRSRDVLQHLKETV